MWVGAGAVQVIEHAAGQVPVCVGRAIAHMSIAGIPNATYVSMRLAPNVVCVYGLVHPSTYHVRVYVHMYSSSSVHVCRNPSILCSLLSPLQRHPALRRLEPQAAGKRPLSNVGDEAAEEAVDGVGGGHGQVAAAGKKGLVCLVWVCVLLGEGGSGGGLLWMGSR